MGNDDQNKMAIMEAARELIYADRAVSDFEAKHDMHKNLNQNELAEMREIYRKKTAANNHLISLLRANGLGV